MNGDAAQCVLTMDDLGFDRGARTVLDSVTLRLARTEVLAVMGPSGCGKSTLLALAAGLLQPTRGVVSCHCTRHALMFQEPRLLPWRSALDNVAFALKGETGSRGRRRARAQDALAKLGLEGGDLHKFPRQLSGGMRQRVALARALVVEPDLLLLDEPFGALDTGLAQRLRAGLRTYLARRRASAVIVTHDPREALFLAARVLVLSPSPGRVAREISIGPADSDDAQIDRLERLEAALLPSD